MMNFWWKSSLLIWKEYRLFFSVITKLLYTKWNLRIKTAIFHSLGWGGGYSPISFWLIYKAVLYNSWQILSPYLSYYKKRPRSKEEDVNLQGILSTKNPHKIHIHKIAIENWYNVIMLHVYGWDFRI